MLVNDLPAPVALALEYIAQGDWNDPDVLPWIRFTGFYDVDHMNEFWGIGPDTDEEEDESGFSWERWGGVAAAGLPEGWVLSGDVHAHDPEAGRRDDNRACRRGEHRMR